MKFLTRAALVVSIGSIVPAAFAVAPLVADTFQTIRYTTPDAWKAEKSEKVVILTPKQAEEGKLMAILVVPGGNSEGTADEALDQVWKSFLKGTEMEGDIKSKKTYKTEKGVKYIQGIGSIIKGEEKMVAMMNVFEANGRFEYVMVIGSDVELIKKHADAIAGFMNTLDFVSDGEKKEDAPAKSGGLIDLR